MDNLIEMNSLIELLELIERYGNECVYYGMGYRNAARRRRELSDEIIRKLSTLLTFEVALAAVRGDPAIMRQVLDIATFSGVSMENAARAFARVALQPRSDDDA